jgi:hypothetical protein
MVAKKGTRSTKKVKSLPTKAVSAKQAKNIKGGSFSFGKTSKRMPTAVE